MSLNDTLIDLLTPLFDKMGYDIIRLQLQGTDKRRTFQIMAERKDGEGMRVEDCARLSRAISPILEEHDPIEGDYTLEISSPGLDRPLVKLSDFDRFKGFEAKIETLQPIDGRKRFAGILVGTENDQIILTFEGKNITLPFAQVSKAKLVLNDALIKAFASTADDDV